MQCLLNCLRQLQGCYVAWRTWKSQGIWYLTKKIREKSGNLSILSKILEKSGGNFKAWSDFHANFKIWKKKSLPVLKFFQIPWLFQNFEENIEIPWLFPDFFGQISNSLTFPGSPGCIATTLLIIYRELKEKKKNLNISSTYRCYKNMFTPYNTTGFLFLNRINDSTQILAHLLCENNYFTNFDFPIISYFFKKICSKILVKSRYHIATCTFLHFMKRKIYFKK